MFSVFNLLNRPIQLPPISHFSTNLPMLTLDLSEDIPEIPNRSEYSRIEPKDDVYPTQFLIGTRKFEKRESVAGQYTLADDLSIFKSIGSYYGMHFQGKIPWSFWQTYKRATKCDRSTSSLYHHWNGAMQKKYGGFISSGKIKDCIAWLEAASQAESNSMNSSSVEMNKTQQQGNINSNSIIIQSGNENRPSGMPLIQQHSEPPVQLRSGEEILPSQLIRTASCINDPFH